MKNLKIRLTQDEREALEELLQSPGWKPLLLAIEQLVANQEQAILRYSIDEGVDQLVHLKLRAEGARKLRLDIEQIKDVYRKQAR